MIRPSVAGFALALSLLVVSADVVRGQQTLYGISGAGDFITIDTATAAATLINSPGGGFSVGLDFRGTKLYVLNQNTGKVRQIDPATGTFIGGFMPSGLPGGPTWWEGDIVFDQATGLGYIAAHPQAPANQDFMSFDLTVPSSNALGALAAQIDGLAFDGAGKLFGLAEGGGQLYKVNKANGNLTAIGGGTGIVGTGAGLGGLAFDAAGKLYAVVSFGAFPGTSSNLYTVNPVTGMSNLVGTITGGYVLTGIRFGAVDAVTVNPVVVSAVEGGATGTYTVVLNGAPTANVTITPTPDAQETVAPLFLTFTPGNWNVPQTVTVTAFNHGVYIPPHIGIITHAAASADVNYNGIAVANVTVNITSSLPPPSSSPTGGAGSGAEGSFAGSQDPAGAGQEGAFGNGGHLMLQPPGGTLRGGAVLAGPYLDLPGTAKALASAGFAVAPPAGSHLCVYNVSGQLSAQANGAPAASAMASTLGWTVLTALALVGAVALAKAIRPAAS